MTDVRDWPMSTRVAAAGLAAALVVNAVVLFRTDDVGAAPRLSFAPVARIVARPLDDAEIVRQAAGRAPFGGTPATEQMLASSAILQQSTVALPLARPRLLGTVVDESGGGFVVVELPDARVQLVRIGERAGELRLRSVTAGEAVFDDLRDGRITLKTSPPDSRP